MSRLLSMSLCAVLFTALAAGAQPASPPPPQPVPGGGGGNESDPKKLGELIENLGSSDWDERSNAEKELEAIGKPAVEALTKAMKESTDPEVKVRAKRILQKLGALEKEALSDEQVEEMLELMRSQDGVAWYGSSGSPSWYLYQLNQNPEWNEALKGKALAPKLTKALGDESGNLKRNATYLLGEMGATESAPQIAKLLKDEELTTRATAAWALGKIGNIDVADQVVVALSDNEPQVRRAAAIALENLPSAAAIDPLLAAMASDDGQLRFQAYFSLRSLTGQRFRFNAFAGESDRKEALKSIQDWWSKSKAGFKPLPPAKREELGKGAASDPDTERAIEVAPK
ncbi:MAG: HEAT repeat domain-containing protein [Planctomycetes bacterium]|nr:HEAT repeat domain-containing protein [Planctomycetota bacterium]